MVSAGAAADRAARKRDQGPPPVSSRNNCSSPRRPSAPAVPTRPMAIQKQAGRTVQPVHRPRRPLPPTAIGARLRRQDGQFLPPVRPERHRRESRLASVVEDGLGIADPAGRARTARSGVDAPAPSVVDARLPKNDRLNSETELGRNRISASLNCCKVVQRFASEFRSLELNPD